MKYVERAASVLLTLSLLTLVGCEEVSSRLDPLSVSGRDGGATPLSAETLMGIGAAAHAGGDLANALPLYRESATVQPSAAAPLVAIGNTLIDTNHVNEALVAFKSAFEREARDPQPLRGLKGDRKAAQQLASMALEPSAVLHNLAYYDRLRALSPEARSRAVRSLGAGTTAPGS